jgi:hypothetical protein
MRLNMDESLAFPSKIINYYPVNASSPKYVAFVRQPDVARLLLVAAARAHAVGMVGFAMLMFLREQLGDYALAGAAVGCSSWRSRSPRRSRAAHRPLRRAHPARGDRPTLAPLAFLVHHVGGCSRRCPIR